ncbi:hypothetical protein B0H19DRAFT_1244330 [Mycena capillaripes]|nr:hypothetical protein B0H19DRAFT_1244330 [Mycena capillaripes]
MSIPAHVAPTYEAVPGTLQASTAPSADVVTAHVIPAPENAFSMSTPSGTPALGQQTITAQTIPPCPSPPLISSRPSSPPPLPSRLSTISIPLASVVPVHGDTSRDDLACEDGRGTPRLPEPQTVLALNAGTPERAFSMSIQGGTPPHCQETTTAYTMAPRQTVQAQISNAASAYTMAPRDSASQDGTRPDGADSPSAKRESAPPIVSGWGKFFTEDMSATPVFIHLLGAIFTYLDTRRTGTLTPEVYSRFLINQGCVGQENIWNANLVASFGQTKEEVADAALKRNFDLFGIEYILQARDRPTTPAADTVKRQFKFVARAITPSVSGGMMPLLTRRGFTKITALETLCNPARHWGNLACIVKMYDLPEVRAWGDLPRDVLPDEADPRILARVAGVRALAKEKDKGQLRRVAGNAAGYAKSTLNKIDTRDAVTYAARQINKVDAQDVANVTSLLLIGARLSQDVST